MTQIPAPVSVRPRLLPLERLVLFPNPPVPNRRVESISAAVSYSNRNHISHLGWSGSAVSVVRVNSVRSTVMNRLRKSSIARN